MSRELKFRVWDTIAEIMTYPEGGLYCITMIGCVCDDETDSGGDLENRDYRSEAMQFTGLYDRNGKHIYEGDIVKAELMNLQAPFAREDCLGSVVFSEFEWCIETDISSWLVASWKCVNTCEVIGNIHENPELLEE